MDELRAKNAELLAKLEELKAQVAAGMKTEPGSSVARSGDANAEVSRPGRFELETLVSDFNPDIPTCESAESWLQNVESTAEAYGWQDLTKFYCARMHLQGAARLWWNGVQCTVKNVGHISTAASGSFPRGERSSFNS